MAKYRRKTASSGTAWRRNIISLSSGVLALWEEAIDAMEQAKYHMCNISLISALKVNNEENNRNMQAKMSWKNGLPGGRKAEGFRHQAARGGLYHGGGRRWKTNSISRRGRK